MYMLDTNTCIYVLKNRSRRLRHRFKVTRSLCISVITYSELCCGVEHSQTELRRQRWAQLHDFTRLLLIEPLGESVGQHYGRLRALLRRQGRPIGNNDLFIAAHALSLGSVLVTNNEREFSQVPDLTYENWLL
jgi:tRNA(fMet)-specific endonuclease VapC